MKYVYLSLLLFLFACSSGDDIAEKKLPEVELKEALQLVADEDYEEAVKDLFAITIKHAGTKVAEEAQYYLAKSYFFMDKFLLSGNHFRYLYERYPKTAYYEEAMYMEAVCYVNLSPGFALDQKYTYEAIKKIDDFLLYFPESKYVDDANKFKNELEEKIVYKKLNSAEIYRALNKYNAALKYTEQLLQEIKESQHLEACYFLRVRIYVEMEEWLKAEQELELMSNKFKNSTIDLKELESIKEDIRLGKLEKTNG